VFAAIVERDAEGAEQALRNHLGAAWEYVRGTFADNDLQGSETAEP
jgi:DNA-binding GntR family transcriptional regulator